MDYKEKYNKLVEAIKVLQETNTSDEGIQNWVNENVPELKESEDERIREALVELVHDTTGDSLWIDYNVHKEDAIAWLEKQGKQKHIDNLTSQEAMDIAVAKCFEQGEQNPVDKVEPKFKVKYAGREYNVLEIKENMGITWYGIEDEPNHIDYVKANSCEIISGYAIKENGSPYPTKPAIFAGHNPTEEDMKEALRTEYEKGRADAFVQMQKGWSEKDEKMLNSIIEDFGDGKTSNMLQEYWLKSLKQRIGG